MPVPDPDNPLATTSLSTVIHYDFGWMDINNDRFITEYLVDKDQYLFDYDRFTPEEWARALNNSLRLGCMRAFTRIMDHYPQVLFTACNIPESSHLDLSLKLVWHFYGAEKCEEWLSQAVDALDYYAIAHLIKLFEDKHHDIPNIIFQQAYDVAIDAMENDEDYTVLVNLINARINLDISKINNSAIWLKHAAIDENHIAVSTLLEAGVVVTEKLFFDLIIHEDNEALAVLLTYDIDPNLCLDALRTAIIWQNDIAAQLLLMNVSNLEDVSDGVVSIPFLALKHKISPELRDQINSQLDFDLLAQNLYNALPTDMQSKTHPEYIRAELKEQMHKAVWASPPEQVEMTDIEYCEWVKCAVEDEETFIRSLPGVDTYECLAAGEGAGEGI